MCFQRCFVALAFLVATAASSRADIFRWDNGQLIPGTEGITPGPGVQLDHHELAYAALSDLDLTGSRFDFSNLSYAYLFLDAHERQPERGQPRQRNLYCRRSRTPT